jgi:hypothetical protein
LFIFATNSSAAQTYQYNFDQDTAGWEAGFADYRVDTSDYPGLDLRHARRPLPKPLDTQQYGLFISGDNHSDDLFMFHKRRISGLELNTAYALTFEIEFASKYPTNALGVGGPPGEGVIMKVGATRQQPIKIRDNGFWRMNIDKSNQIQPGEDMDTIGHVGISDTTTVYALKTNHNRSHPFEAVADDEGQLWLIFGTESGFEATTSLYYNRIRVDFGRLTGVETPAADRSTPCIWYHDGLQVEAHSAVGALRVFDMSGRMIMRRNLPAPGRYRMGRLPRGLYLVEARGERTCRRKLLVE